MDAKADVGALIAEPGPPDMRAEVAVRHAEVPAEAKLRQAEVAAEAKLVQAEVAADAKLRHAELEAEIKLVQAEVAAVATLQRASIPAVAMLLRAEADAEATLLRAQAPADAKLLQAEIEAEAMLQRAQAPANAKLLQAEVEAEARLRRAEVPAEAKLLQAEVDAEAMLRRAEVPAEAKLLQAELDAEATLLAAEEDLAHQRDVFERFFALSVDMMCMSTDGYFTRVSQSFDSLGHSREELLSQPALALVHPDDQAATLVAHGTLVPGGATISFENRCRRKDGTYRWLSWASGMDVSGMVYSMARDVTEARLHHEALTRAKDAAENVNRELESFNYSVAHDLRAPLRSIDSFSQALLEDYVGKLDATGKKYLSFIRESAQHMSHLIDDLLGLSRIVRTAMSNEAVDLSSLARASITRLQTGQLERRIDVRIQEDLGDQGDPRLLGIVLDNLIGNAWKFTGRRADARIEFAATTKDGQPVYFVRDNGAGFDMAFASRLFGVFQRLHTAAEFEGTGVGLATVQRIIGRHGGRVWVEGEVERGATFFFTLHDPPPAPPASA
jgi:PAS domain S-box-containing protein